jgi:hypothetical protein
MYQMSGTGTTKNPIPLKEQHRNVHLLLRQLKTGSIQWSCPAHDKARFLWMRWRTFGFHEMRVISWVAENRIASQEGLCFMQFSIQYSPPDLSGASLVQVNQLVREQIRLQHQDFNLDLNKRIYLQGIPRSVWWPLRDRPALPPPSVGYVR